jgi:uncharacterized membrane protein YdfJ with MMPL/SSD domain
MTLSSRNMVFKAGIVFSLAILVFLLIASYTVLPFYPDLPRMAAGLRDFWQPSTSAFWPPLPWYPILR